MNNNFKQLKVCKANKDDVFGDIIRVHKDYRKDQEKDIDESFCEERESEGFVAFDGGYIETSVKEIRKLQ